MTKALRLAITADLHWGIRPSGDDATRLLVSFLQSEPPDVLILAGDIGAGKDFSPCLQLFADLSSTKLLVPGNHDIWVETNDPRGDSWDLYDRVLPELAQRHGFHYLDKSPLLLKESKLTIVGSINWYDYSWSIDRLREQDEHWQEKLERKQFTRGRHNDGRFVRWRHTDTSFTEEVVAKLGRHLEEALGTAPHAIVITHHPAFYGLSFPRDNRPANFDSLLWDAFSGNRPLEELLLRRQSAQIPLVFSGHTHRERINTLGQTTGYNIGGDYHFKRLLLLDWPSGTVTAHTFGNPFGH